jgi:hypothetical protein
MAGMKKRLNGLNARPKIASQQPVKPANLIAKQPRTFTGENNG